MRVEISRFVTVDHVDGYVLLVVSGRLPVVGHPNNGVVGVVAGRRSVGFIIGSSYESQTTGSGRSEIWTDRRRPKSSKQWTAFCFRHGWR